MRFKIDRFIASCSHKELDAPQIVTPSKDGVGLATSCALKKPNPGLRRDDGLSGKTQVFGSDKT